MKAVDVAAGLPLPTTEGEPATPRRGCGTQHASASRCLREDADRRRVRRLSCATNDGDGGQLASARGWRVERADAASSQAVATLSAGRSGLSTGPRRGRVAGHAVVHRHDDGRAERAAEASPPMRWFTTWLASSGQAGNWRRRGGHAGADTGRRLQPHGHGHSGSRGIRNTSPQGRASRSGSSARRPGSPGRLLAAPKTASCSCWD